MTDLASNKRLESLTARYKDQYKTAASTSYWHGLVVSVKGVGKTYLIKTMPKPVFVFSFDPGGTDTLIKEKKEGSVIIETYETDDFSKPHAYMNFQKDINEMGSTGFLKEFASVCFDSLTLLQSIMVSHLMKVNGRLGPTTGLMNPTEHGMRIQDWGTILTLMRMHITQLHSLPCHTLMTGHVEKKLDEIKGGFVRQLSLGGASKNHIPYMTSEVYYLLKQDRDKGDLKKGSRYLLTEGDGDYEATSRLAVTGKIKQYEEPNLRRLMKNVGLEADDKDWRP